MFASAPTSGSKSLPAPRLVLTTVTILAAALSVWRLGTDLGWISDSLIAKGLVSHWQFWFAIAISAPGLHQIGNQTRLLCFQRLLRVMPRQNQG